MTKNIHTQHQRIHRARTEPQSGVLQRKCACGHHTGDCKCAECRKQEEQLQRTATATANGKSNSMPSMVDSVIRSSGQSLDLQTRNFMEAGFGNDFTRVRLRTAVGPMKNDWNNFDNAFEREADRAAMGVVRGDSPTVHASSGATPDFSDVRLHTDANAAAAAAALNARAYTVGHHVVFAAGEYTRNTSESQFLLAHELAHVVQQSDSAAAAFPQRKGGSIGGFFANIGREIADLVTGSEPEYDSGELQSYLQRLESANNIEDDFDSDNKARAVVRRELHKGTSLRIRELLIREMLSGFTWDDDEQSILTILEGASVAERTSLAESIGYGVLEGKFHGSELDRLYVLYPILNQMFPRGKDESKSHTFSQYIDKWEIEHGRTMSFTEKSVLARGCVGITALNLNTIEMPDLSHCYDTFGQVWGAAQEIRRFLAQNYPDRNVLIFSKRFWSGGREFKPDPNTGQVDMSERTYSRPGFTNFDYGLFDERTGKWWHANHCDQPFLAEPKCHGAMSVFESNLEHYSRSLADFDRQVFCWAVVRI